MHEFDSSHDHALAPSLAEGAPATGAPAPTKRARAAGQLAGALGSERIGAAAVPPPPPAASASAKAPWALDEAKLMKMTVSELQSYTSEHPDWANHPALGKGSPLWELLVWIRRMPGTGQALSAFTCEQLLKAGVGIDKAYAGYVVAFHTGQLKRAAPTVERAREYGAAIQRLLGVMPLTVLLTAVPQGSDAGDCLDMLIDGKLLDAFVEYVRVVRPLLPSTNGADVAAFAEFYKETGGKVTKYVGQLRNVRNHHHFEVQALERLVENERDTSRSRPLLLMLQSAADHNGAFMRDSAMTAAILDRRNNAIVLEGAKSLSMVSRQAQAIAARYGKNGKIDQLLLSGHGQAQSIEMGADRDHNGGMVAQPVSLVGDTSESVALIQKLLRMMDPSSPHHRIVLHACLTNSNMVSEDTKIEGKGEIGVTQVRNALAVNPSLAEFVRRTAKDLGIEVDVVGSNASTYSGKPGNGYIDPKTGAIDLVYPYDQSVTGTKLDHLLRGKEPIGAMRALVESWASNQAGARSAVETRLAGGKRDGEWNDAVIRALLRLALDSWNDAGRIVHLARSSETLMGLRYAGQVIPAELRNVVEPRDAAAIFSALATTADWQEAPVRLVVQQVWMRSDAKIATAFINDLGANFTTVSVRPYFDADLAQAAEPAMRLDSAGSFVLALLLAETQRPTSIKFLRDLHKRGPLPSAFLALTAGTLSQGEFVAKLNQLGQKQTEQPRNAGTKHEAPPPPSPNVKLGDGSEHYVDSLVENRTAMKPVLVFDEPRVGQRPRTTLIPGTVVRVTGRVGVFVMVALPGDERPGFMYEATLPPT